MKNMRRQVLFSTLVLGLSLVASVLAQGTNDSSRTTANKDEGRKISRTVAGQKQKVRGTIVKPVSKQRKSLYLSILETITGLCQPGS